MSIEFTVVEYGSVPYSKGLQLRQEVLRTPLGLTYSAEEIAAESSETHIIGCTGDSIVATASLVAIAPGLQKIRQVAVSPAFQSQGLGKKLVEYTELVAKTKFGTHQIELHSRTSVIGFYQQLGYSTVDQEFTEIGISHQKMSKPL